MLTSKRTRQSKGAFGVIQRSLLIRNPISQQHEGEKLPLTGAIRHVALSGLYKHLFSDV